MKYTYMGDNDNANNNNDNDNYDNVDDGNICRLKNNYILLLYMVFH